MITCAVSFTILTYYCFLDLATLNLDFFNMITKGLVEVDDILIRKYLLGDWSFLFKKDLMVCFFCWACYIHVTWHVFRSSHFSFLVFCHLWRRSYKNSKILRNLSLHFARQGGQGKMGKTQKIWKENHFTKVTKIPKTKERKYGMNKTMMNFIFLTLSL